MTVKMYPERPKEWGPLGIRIMIGSRNGLNFISDKKSTPPKPENSYEAKQRAREEILNKARAQYKDLPSLEATDAPAYSKDPAVALYPAKDQSELKTVYDEARKSRLLTIAIEYFILCEPTFEMPFKSVRSRMNGGHVLIKLNGQWVRPPQMLWTQYERGLGQYPGLTQEDYDAWGTFAA